VAWGIAIALGIFAALINMPIREKPLARLVTAQGFLPPEPAPDWFGGPACRLTGFSQSCLLAERPIAR